jgi:hypothetical protein
MNNRLHNKLASFSGTGSFWSKNMEETEQVPFTRALSRLVLGSSFQSIFEESVGWLSGSREVLVENLLWQFKESQVLALNAELNQRIKAKAADLIDGKIYIAIARPQNPDYSKWSPLFLSQDPENLSALMTELDDFILWPTSFTVGDDLVIAFEDRKIHYILPITHGFTPIVITTEHRELVIGLDFEARDGFLVFFEPPLSLFPARNFVVRAAWKKLQHPHDFVWGVEGI